MKAKFIIDQLINIHGYVSIDQFMKIAVKEYYANENAIGLEADFITSPEISQMFGEIVGVWCAEKFIERGYKNFALLEMGPGRGTMMSDLLRGTKNVPGFHEALSSIILLENSDKMRHQQAQNLAEYHNKLRWIESIEDLETQENIIVLANEFFDALPIKQFQLINGEWLELGVTRKIGETDFAFAPVRKSLLDLGSHNAMSILEVSPESERVCKRLSTISTNLDALIIDYGYFEPTHHSTLQAVKQHSNHNPLSEIGSADVTAHVDFQSLSKNFTEEGFITTLSTQSEFLKNYGIDLRADQLIENGAVVADIKSALDRLTSDAQMGTLFKAMTASSAK